MTEQPPEEAQAMPDTTPENDTPRNGLVSPPPADQGGQDAPQAQATEDAPAPGKRLVPVAERRHLKAVEGAKIAAKPPENPDLVFMAREFITCTLPHSDPGPVLSWSRTNGNFTLAITSGVNGKTGQPYGIPYGIIPRLLLAWIVTEIIQKKSRRLELGNRFPDFLLKLGLDPSNGTGKRSDARRAREQIERLIHALIQFIITTDGGRREDGKKMLIADDWGLWWENKSLEQGFFWDSYVVVSQRFFDEVIKSSSPLDIRVLRHVKDSSLGIDLYTILNREAYLAMKDGKNRFLAWDWIQERTGSDYTEGKAGFDQFRRKALEQIKVIMAVHPGLVLKIVKGRKGQKSGIGISHLSNPSVLPREPRRAPLVIEGQARPAPSLSTVPTGRAQTLRPAAVETFRARYPGLARSAVYDCQAAFDAWQAKLEPEKRAQHYNTAFLGFAKRWVVGKI